MAEDLQGLIEKINQEGVQAAESKARDIENDAKNRADEIIAKAGKEADAIVAEAKSEVAKMEKSGEASLKQAGRNLLLSLRKEISATLDRLIALRLRETLKPAAMIKIITSLVKDYSGEEKDIIVSLSKEDAAEIKKDFLSELRGELKKGLALRPSDDIYGGFIISYDGGRSHYDFTDTALAEYIGAHLRPELRGILESAVSDGKKS